MHISQSLRYGLLGLLLLFPLPGAALDIDRLWLPTEYRGHYLKLRDAALAAEATSSCHEVLRGTLDMDLSTAELPVYRILCRREDGVSYTELVDGDTLEPRSLTRPPAPPELPHEREQRLAREQRLVEQRQRAAKAGADANQAALTEGAAPAAQEDIAPTPAADTTAPAARVQAPAPRQQVLGEVCQSEILARTAMMMDLVWLTERPLVDELDNGQMRFTAEFNARDMWGNPLEYEAVCTISTPRELVVVISPRNPRNPRTSLQPLYLP